MKSRRLTSERTNVSKKSRALRRHHDQRRKTWAEKNLQNRFSGSDKSKERRIGIYARTPKLCSCRMCGNPRHTHQEIPFRECRLKSAWKFSEYLGRLDPR